MKNGNAMIIDGCLACFSIPATIVGGSAKGRRLYSSDASGHEKWLLEITLLLSRVTDAPVETLTIKQYYFPKP